MNQSSLTLLIYFLVYFLVISIIIYFVKNKFNPNAKAIRAICRGKTPEQTKVIVFLKEGMSDKNN